jgi:electron transfer flavoprotein beta subunit
VHIAVFTRSTPDTQAAVTVSADGAVTWGDAALIVNPWDEYALEEAIVQAKAANGKTTALAVGAEMHNEALKHALAMGIDAAIRIDDPALTHADGLAYATAAAAAVRKLADVDLVMFGRESIDVGTDQHVYQTARKLGWTMLSSVSKIIAVDAAAKTIKVERLLEQGKQIVTAALPVVISVTKEINEPRYPTFMGIRKAAKAQIPVWSLADIGAALPGSGARIVGFKNLPAREVTLELIDGTPEEMAEKLLDRLIEEKVL